MRVRFALVAATSTVVSACGGGGPAGPPALAYSLPATTSVTYVTGDTASMDIDAGGQSMQARTRWSSTLAVDFSRAPEGIRVSLDVTDLAGRVDTPISSGSADESGIDGPLVFTLDRRGGVTLVSQPGLTAEASQFYQPVAIANSFFPRLPGRAAQVGEQWTDTVTFGGPQGPGQVKAVNILTYTVVGDTVVDGRSLVRLDVEGTSDVQLSGLMAGMDFSQSLKGRTDGWVLFDLSKGLLVESRSDEDVRGNMDVSAAPYPLGVRLRTRSWVKLQDSM